MLKSSACIALLSLPFALFWQGLSAQEVPPLVEFVPKTALHLLDLSDEQDTALKSIQTDPAAFDVRIGRSVTDTVQDVLAFTLQLPNGSVDGQMATASFRHLVLDRRMVDDYSLWSDPSSTDLSSSVSIVVMGRDLYGTIRHSATTYKLHPLGDGLTAVYRYDVDKLPDHPDNYSEFLKDESRTRRPRKPRPPRAFKSKDIVIDVLVAYTQRARNEAVNIDALIRLAFDETQQIYSRSQVVPRLRLVHSYLEKDYTEDSDMLTDINRLSSTRDGYLDEVHKRRDEYQADLAVLIVGNGKGCGIGHQYSTRTRAFSVVRQNCATGKYTFAHELGHNQGAHHNPDEDKNIQFSYGHGLCNSSGRWRTVMSYASTISCFPRLGYFSNPRVFHSGMATGDVTLRNNARVINETALDMADFRVSDCGNWTDWKGVRRDTRTFF